VTVFIDTAVLMYAAGSEHPLRAPCQQVLDRIGRGELTATTSTEVVQEIVHRYLAIGRPDLAVVISAGTLDLFAPVLPVTHALMRRVPRLADRYPDLAARDLIHVATCIHEGIDTIVTTDAAFDAVREIHRIDPRELVA
jgi:hypothetical protein